MPQDRLIVQVWVLSTFAPWAQRWLLLRTHPQSAHKRCFSEAHCGHHLTMTHSCCSGGLKSMTWSVACLEALRGAQTNPWQQHTHALGTPVQQAAGQIKLSAHRMTVLLLHAAA